MQRIAQPWRVTVPTVMLVLLGCGGDLTLPGTTAPGLAVAALQAARPGGAAGVARAAGRGRGGAGGEGEWRGGTAGQERPKPVVVEVKTEGGQGMPGRGVAF